MKDSTFGRVDPSQVWKHILNISLGRFKEQLLIPRTVFPTKINWQLSSVITLVPIYSHHNESNAGNEESQAIYILALKIRDKTRQMLFLLQIFEEFACEGIGSCRLLCLL